MKHFLWLMLLLVLGCGSSTPVVGIVQGKQFVPAHTDTVLVPIQTPHGVMYIPQSVYHPAVYYLTVRDDQGREHSVCVTQEMFEKARVGDHYPS